VLLRSLLLARSRTHVVLDRLIVFVIQETPVRRPLASDRMSLTRSFFSRALAAVGLAKETVGVDAAGNVYMRWEQEQWSCGGLSVFNTSAHTCFCRWYETQNGQKVERREVKWYVSDVDREIGAHEETGATFHMHDMHCRHNPEPGAYNPNQMCVVIPLASQLPAIVPHPALARQLALPCVIMLIGFPSACLLLIEQAILHDHGRAAAPDRSTSFCDADHQNGGCG
jgi:hypothetical protein